MLPPTKVASFAAVSFGNEFGISFCGSSKRRKRHLLPLSLSETKASFHAAETKTESTSAVSVRDESGI